MESKKKKYANYNIDDKKIQKMKHDSFFKGFNI